MILRGDDGRTVEVRQDRARPHRLRIVQERHRGEPGFGGDLGVYLDGMRLCWHRVELVLNQDEFVGVALTLTVGEIEFDADAVVALRALIET